VYVFVQFVWWGYHLIELSNEVAETSNSASKHVVMILGEGLVFLLLLVVGIWQIHRSIRRELKFSERQNNFLLSVTHELKTPLAANKLYLQTITRRELPFEQQVELIRKAIDENTRLERMIDNILNASRLENNALKPEKEEVNLKQLMDLVAQRFNSLIGRETIRTVGEDIHFKGDRFMLETILNNLVENALKYAGREGQIVVYTAKEGAQIILGVRDNGPGIDPHFAKDIFTKFFRVGNEDVRTQKGSGLGLFIVAELVKMHKGHVQYLPNNPLGADFKITFHHDK
jgi:signal transduction histidine kinase